MSLQSDLEQLELETQARLAAAQADLAAIERVKRLLATLPGIPAGETATKHELLQRALEDSGRPLTASELAEKLTEAGYAFQSTNPANVVYVAMKEKPQIYTAEKQGGRTLFSLRPPLINGLDLEPGAEP